MKDMDNIMKKYVSSFSADKEKDLQKLRSVSWQNLLMLQLPTKPKNTLVKKLPVLKA